MSNFAERSGAMVNWSAGIAWIVTLGIVLMLPIEIFFKGLPGWFIAVFIFSVLSMFEQKLIVKRAAAMEE